MENHVERATHSDHRATYGDDSDSGEEAVVGGERNLAPAPLALRIPVGTNLADVVKALNGLGATPMDLVSILQAMKAAGALRAELEVI